MMRRVLLALLGAALLPGCGNPLETPPESPVWCTPPPPRPESFVDQPLSGLPGLTMEQLGLERPLWPSSIRVSADGTELAGLHGNQVLVWDALEGGEPQRSYGEATHPHAGGHLVATPDFSRFVVQAGPDGLPELVDGTSGARETIPVTLRHEHEVVRTIDLDPEGEQLATITNAGNVEIRSLSTGEQTQAFPACVDSPDSLRFSPDGRFLFIGNFGPNGAQVWDVSTGKQVATLRNEDMEVRLASWSADGTTLAIAVSAFNSDDGSWNIMFVDTGSWETITTWPQFSPTMVEYMSSGELLVSERSIEFLVLDSEGTAYPHPTPVMGRVVLPSPESSIVYVANEQEIGGTHLDPDHRVIDFVVPPFDCDVLADPEPYEECD